MDGRSGRTPIPLHRGDELRLAAVPCDRFCAVSPWPAGVEPNYPKIAVTLVIIVILGALLGIGSALQRRSGAPVAQPIFIAVGMLLPTAAGIGVLW